MSSMTPTSPFILYQEQETATSQTTLSSVRDIHEYRYTVTGIISRPPLRDSSVRPSRHPKTLVGPFRIISSSSTVVTPFILPLFQEVLVSFVLHT